MCFNKQLVGVVVLLYYSLSSTTENVYIFVVFCQLCLHENGA